MYSSLSANSTDNTNNNGHHYDDSNGHHPTLAEEILERLDGFHPGTHLEPRQVLFYEGEDCREVYCLRSGKAKLYKTGLEGKQYILRIASAGEVVGLDDALAEGPASATAEMIDSGVVHRLDGHATVELLRRESGLALRVSQSQARKLRISDDERLELAQAAVRERTARLLAHLAADHGVPMDDGHGVRIDLQLSREEMAGMIGTAQETVIRQLSEFKHDRLIRLDGRHITVLDPAGLAAAAHIF